MANKITNFFNEINQTQRIKDQRLAEAKKKGFIPMVREAVIFPWEQKNYLPQNQPSPTPSPFNTIDLEINARRLQSQPTSRPTVAPTMAPSARPVTPRPAPTIPATPQPLGRAPGMNLFNRSTPTPQPMQSPGFAGNPSFTQFLQQRVNPRQQKQVIPPDLSRAIDAASKKYNIPRDYLAGLAYHEGAGFNNVPQRGGGGGRGYFQIDKYYHPNISDAQAYDPAFAADYAGRLLQEGLNHGATPEQLYLYYNGGARALPNYQPKDRADAKRMKTVQKNARQHTNKSLSVFDQYDFD